jgi:adenylate cyclase
MAENSSEAVSTPSRWSPLTAGLALSLVVAAALISASLLGFKPEGPDAWTYDWRTMLFSKQASAQRNDVAVVFIGEESVADYDYVSPVDRGLLARLIRALDEAKVKAIGLDFIFDRKTESAKTRELLEAIRNSRAPIAIGAFDKRAGFRPEHLSYQESFFKEAGPKLKIGHVFFARDIDNLKTPDGVVRYMGDTSSEEPRRKSLSAVLAEVAGKTEDPATRRIAWQLAPPQGDLFATFTVPRHSPGASLDKILPPNWRSSLEGKIVLVGGNFLDRDRHLTPLAVWDNAKIPGVLIQAQVLAQRLDGRAVYDMPKYVEFPLLVVLCFVGFLISQQYASKKLDYVLYAGGVAVFVVSGIALFAIFSMILPTTLLLLAWTAGVYGAHYTKDVLHKISVAVRAAPKATKVLINKSGEQSPQQT